MDRPPAWNFQERVDGKLKSNLQWPNAACARICLLVAFQFANWNKSKGEPVIKLAIVHTTLHNILHIASTCNLSLC